MKILDEQGIEVFDPDMTLGRLIPEIITEHIPAVEAVEETGHYEVVRTYDNGGMDLEFIVDTPGAEGCAAHDEDVLIQRYVEYTAEELAAMQQEQNENKPTQLDRIESQVVYTAMMTGTMLEGAV